MKIELDVEIGGGCTLCGLALEDLGEGRYRVVDLPDPFNDCFNYNDVVELELIEKTRARLLRIQSESRWSRSVILISKNCDEELLTPVYSRVEAEGGQWCIDCGGILQIFLPPDCAWDPTTDIKPAMQ